MPECWHDRHVPAPTLVLSKELVGALEAVLGHDLAAPGAAVLLARYIDELAKGYGLTEHKESNWNPLEHAEKMLRLPAAAAAVVRYYLPESAATNGDAIRQRLYAVFQRIDRDAIGAEYLDDVRTLAQMYWNLDRDKDERPRLPLDLGAIKVDVVTKKLSRHGTDFSALTWTKRVAVSGVHTSSSGRLRRMGACLAVFAAISIIEEKDRASGATASPAIPPTLGGATLEPSEAGQLHIVWALEKKMPTQVLSQRHGLDQGAPTAAIRRSIAEHSLVRPKLAKAFEGREAELDELAKFCTSGDEDRLIVVGERYSGKSALMAEFFVSAGTPSALRLGYFVPTNQRQDARSEAMVKHLVRQAHLLATGEELHLDSGNPGKLRELLDLCVDEASRVGRSVVLFVDGIDEDVSSREGLATMMSVLNGLSTPGLKIIITAWSERAPVETSNWRRVTIRRTRQVAEDLQQMETELETLFDQAAMRRVLQYLTFGFGSFEAEELAQLTGAGSVRLMRKVLMQSDERVFRAVREDGEAERWGFAHPTFAEASRALFEDAGGAWPAGELTSVGAVSAEIDTQVRLESWAQSFRNAGWPTESPRYLLTDYPAALADRADLTGLCRLIFDARYLRAVAGKFGPANPIANLVAQALRLALASGPTANLETIAKLVTVRDNYQPIADSVPLALLEAVGKVSGPVAAKRLSSHIIDHNIDYDAEETADRTAGSTSSSTSQAQIVGALVRAGLADMAREYALKLDEPSVHEAYARALIQRGDKAGAIEAVRAWNSHVEEAAEGKHTAPAAMLELFKRFERLLEASPAEPMQDASAGDGLAETADAPDDDPPAAAVLQQVLAALAEGGDEFWAMEPSILALFDGVKARSRCVRLLREAGDTRGASELAMRLLRDYDAFGQPDAAYALELAAALVWAGHAPEAWKVIRAIPKLAIELAATLRARPGINHHPYLHSGPPGSSILDLLRIAPALPVIEAFGATGDHLGAREFLSKYIHGSEYVQIFAALMAKAGLPDDAFAATDSLDTLPDTTPGLEVTSPFTIRRHQIMLFTLIACEYPESAAAGRAVDQIRQLIAGSHPWAQPLLLNHLAAALNALGRDDEFESVVQQMDDPSGPLVHGIEAAVRRGDLLAALRYSRHPFWTSEPAPAKHRVRALALRAISYWEANDPQRARTALDQALAVAASPIVANSRHRQAVVDAALGRRFDWEQLFSHDIRAGLESLKETPYWLENPLGWSEALGQATVAVLELWQEAKGQPFPGTVSETGSSTRESEAGTEALEAAVGGSVPATWEGWAAAFAGLADAEARGGTDGRRLAALAAFRAAQVQWELDAGTPGPPDVMGYLLIQLVRAGLELKPAWIVQIRNSLDGDSQERLLRSYPSIPPPLEAYAVWAAAESMSRAAIGERSVARTLAVDASKTLTTARATFPAENVDLGLWWCVETFAFLGEPDMAAPLLGYMSPAAASAAPANLALAISYLDQGHAEAALRHAASGLSEWRDPRILRRFDPNLVFKVAEFEDQLWRGNSFSPLD